MSRSATASTVTPAGSLRGTAHANDRSFAGIGAIVFVLIAVAMLLPVFGGPPLADHEAIVAECARNMRLSGDWMVPQFLDTPFVRKPPLPYWLVAAASYLFPPDAVTHLPVTTTVARLPSALAAIGTIFLLWRLAGAMYGRRAGLVTAVLAASCVCFMLFAPNATVEMDLTFCCAWAFYHFWFAATDEPGARQIRNAYLFYVALGVGMLAKGPAPMAMVGLPLAVWWYAEPAILALAEGGSGCAGRAARALIAGLKTRTIDAFKRFRVFTGLPLFALMFVPWMLVVAQRHPHAWNLWNWQYFQRAIGDYPDTKPRGPFYYLPLVLGLIGPWTFALPEALIGPYMKRYAAARRAMIYCGLTALLGIAVMSMEIFKKPYYIVPAVPMLIVMIAAVLDRFYSIRPKAQGVAWAGWALAAVGLAVGMVKAAKYFRHEAPPDIARIGTIVAAVAIAALLVAGALYITGKGWAALGLTALTSIAVFQVLWFTCAPTLANHDKVTLLAKALDDAGAPADAQIFWADQRPDARLSFYFTRQSRYLIAPAEIVSVMVDRTNGKRELMSMVMSRSADLLGGTKPVYIILDRDNYDLAQPNFADRGRLVAEVHVPDERPDKAWMIVANGAPTKATP